MATPRVWTVCFALASLQRPFVDLRTRQQDEPFPDELDVIIAKPRGRESQEPRRIPVGVEFAHPDAAQNYESPRSLVGHLVVLRNRRSGEDKTRERDDCGQQVPAAHDTHPLPIRPGSRE